MCNEMKPTPFGVLGSAGKKVGGHDTNATEGKFSYDQYGNCYKAAAAVVQGPGIRRKEKYNVMRRTAWPEAEVRSAAGSIRYLYDRL